MKKESIWIGLLETLQAGRDLTEGNLSLLRQCRLAEGEEGLQVICPAWIAKWVENLTPLLARILGQMGQTCAVQVIADAKALTLDDLGKYYGEIGWLWEPYITKKGLNILGGYPGHGKTTLSLDLARRIIKGEAWPWPVEESVSTPGKVLWLDTENPVALRERAQLIGLGDSKNLLFPPSTVTGICLDDPILLQEVEAIIKIERPALLVIDSLTGGHFRNELVAREMRGLLQPWNTLAMRFDLALQVNHHLRKPSNLLGLSDDLERPSLLSIRGSSDLVAFARSVMLCWKPDKDESRVEFWAEKFSRTPIKPPTLEFILEDAPVWLGEVKEEATMQTKQQEAAAWLSGKLGGGKVLSKEIYREAKEMGFSDRTLRLAKKKLKVRSVKEGLEWFWSSA